MSTGGNYSELLTFLGHVKTPKNGYKDQGLLTLFHFASEPTYFTLGGGSFFAPSNFVIFKDRDLKFGVYF